jgi:hypothetical protein
MEYDGGGECGYRQQGISADAAAWFRTQASAVVAYRFFYREQDFSE